MFHHPDYARIHWWWIGLSLALSAVGVVFVASATADPGGDAWLTREAGLQSLWWAIAGAAAFVVFHIAPWSWRRLAIPALIGGILLILAMLALAGTPLVPRIKGQANWIVLFGQRLQPVELVKLAALLACATVAAEPGFDARRLTHAAALLAMAAIPSALVAVEDLGSALTFIPMAFGILVAAGMRGWHLALAVLVLAGAVAAGVAALPKEGPKAYQYKRIQAWLHPEDYVLTEGYQAERSKRSIGSGQWLGKGYMAGEQNRLGWVPEKHTDLIFAVVGEEMGFIGSAVLLALFLAWALTGLHAAWNAPDAWGRLCCAGMVSLISGQMAINIAVATGLMPVTGVTLPFVSYGGSSLLGTWLGLGIATAAAAGSRK